MKNIGVILVVLGAVGLAVVAFGFATDFQPMWMHSAKQLPDKDTFTRNEVVTVLVHHVEHVRTRYLLGVILSAIEVAGAVVLLRTQRGKV
jgi:hypothetical protein